MKTRDMWILAGIMAVCIVVSALYVGIAQTTVTWEGILPGISSELGGTYAINIANTASTVGLDVSEETALTNTVNGTIKSTHTTSGTPANSIGNGYWVYQETSAANTEKVMELNAVITDATGASEDASFSVELMAAGAASTEVFSVSSVGAGVFDSGLIVNEDGDDADFRVETDAVASALVIDGADDSIDISVSLHLPDVTISAAQSYTLGAVGKAGNMFLIDSSGASGAFGFVIDDSEIDDGRWFCIADIVDASSNTISIKPDAGTIDGAANIDIVTQFGGACIVYDGTNYWTTSKDL